jgi:peptide/nickel transport system substrate-binding protein
LARCCLVRTLLSYNGQPTSEGGTILQPDVASSLPVVSSDGLTWTFSLQQGLHYSPPLQNTEIVAQDFVRSIERMFAPNPKGVSEPSGYLDGHVVEENGLIDILAGARAFATGEADTISGLGVPDPHTLVIHLTTPDGDLGYLVSLADFMPIPANPYDAGARFGIADGHGGSYSSYMVSSGPYMVEGSENLDYSKPPELQEPPFGDGARSLTLVRNPSWNPSADRLRVAYADRITFVPIATPRRAVRAIRRGAVDILFNWSAPPVVSDRYADDTMLSSHVVQDPLDAQVFLSMNVAMPPLDSVYVRRAMNYAVDREALVTPFRSRALAVPIEHIALDSQENNTLLNFDPWESGSVGSLGAARAEMAQSKYDSDHDGVCDARSCSGIELVVLSRPPAWAAVARGIAADVRPIGLDVRVVRDDDLFYKTFAERVPMELDTLSKEYPSASTILPQLFSSRSIGGCCGYNNSGIGATTAQLRRYGYAIRLVPSVENRIEECRASLFGAQIRCWTALDQYLTTEIAPVVPLLTMVNAQILSDRVTSFAFDQSTRISMPALDRIALRGTTTNVVSPPAGSSSP